MPVRRLTGRSGTRRHDPTHHSVYEYTPWYGQALTRSGRIFRRGLQIYVRFFANSCSRRV
jgi:hypothetical protein